MCKQEYDVICCTSSNKNQHAAFPGSIWSNRQNMMVQPFPAYSHEKIWTFIKPKSCWLWPWAGYQQVGVMSKPFRPQYSLLHLFPKPVFGWKMHSQISLIIMTSSNGNIFRLLEFTADRWIPRTKASDAVLWCFLWGVWINGCANNHDLRRHRGHYDVTVMCL